MRARQLFVSTRIPTVCSSRYILRSMHQAFTHKRSNHMPQSPESLLVVMEQSTSGHCASNSNRSRSYTCICCSLDWGKISMRQGRPTWQNALNTSTHTECRRAPKFALKKTNTQVQSNEHNKCKLPPLWTALCSRDRPLVAMATALRTESVSTSQCCCAVWRAFVCRGNGCVFVTLVRDLLAAPFSSLAQ